MTACTLTECCLGRVLIPSQLRPNAPVAFICAPPDYKALEYLTPLAGQIGQLFETLLNQAGLSRHTCSIISTIRCADFHREDRRPLPGELDACHPRLEEEITLASPQLIFTLGNIAQAFFFPGAKVGQVHGKVRNWQGRLVCASYAPDAALPYRSPELQQVIVQDIKGALSLLD